MLDLREIRVLPSYIGFTTAALQLMFFLHGILQITKCRKCICVKTESLNFKASKRTVLTRKYLLRFSAYVTLEIRIWLPVSLDVVIQLKLMLHFSQRTATSFSYSDVSDANSWDEKIIDRMHGYIVWLYTSIPVAGAYSTDLVHRDRIHQYMRQQQ